MLKRRQNAAGDSWEDMVHIASGTQGRCLLRSNMEVKKERDRERGKQTEERLGGWREI